MSILLVVACAAGCSPSAELCPSRYLNDGDCDDGRLGALTNLCPLGTDEADCANVDPTVCQTTNDGECDDGRPGAPFHICAPGTDEADCAGLPPADADTNSVPPE
ncbi:MAG TPA: hypothetical protein P5572_13910 [Phycisphaerae bacterium]|nr:hypothetical protein [Phycisphaerae bacterium]